MSQALYDIGGLRFWSEGEIQLRNQLVERLRYTLQTHLCKLNSAWTFHQMEGPLLTPRNYINPAYDESDIFLLQAKLGDQEAAMRAETTASSYLYAEYLLKSGWAKPPVCVWQMGKSFRRETNDGARASELRYNEFYQLEFQCIYKDNTLADIRGCAEGAISMTIQDAIHAQDVRMVASDRLPSYSKETRDVEVPYRGKWKEMCSISTRTDFPMDNMLVLEVAIGLDRLVTVMTDHDGRNERLNPWDTPEE